MTGQLQLTRDEATLRRLLVDVAKYVQVEDNKAEPSQLRYTGGWVRDKLLKKDSHDIDVAINDTTGYEFALRLEAYLKTPGNWEKYEENTASATDGDKSRLLRGLHKIQANPDKSKHLETCTIRVFGLDIDLVNLRKEIYDESSRTPQMVFADGPEEDAFRRDATINAMFYNLQTETVEDLTGLGHDDMQNQIIRTPLKPYKTFEDDPLRILRLIRFASRLGYALDPEAKDAMRDSAIKEALRKKISRERVGVEFEKMMNGPDPHTALSLIDEVGLYNDIFCVPPPAPNEKSNPSTLFARNSNFVADPSNWKFSFDTLRELLSSDNTIKSILVPADEVQYLAWTLSCFTPFADAPDPEAPKGSGRLPLPIAATVAREGIKAPNRVSDLVAAALTNASDILAVKDAFIDKYRNVGRVIATYPADRDTLGNAVRRWKESWRLQAVYAYLLDAHRAESSGRNYQEEWSKLLTYLESQDLLEANALKPIVTGKELADALNVRTGPWTTEALKVVITWQLRNPGNSSHENAIEAVRSWRESGSKDKANGQRNADTTAGELTVSLMQHFLSLTIRPLFIKTSTNHSDSITAQARAKQKTGLEPRRYGGYEDESITRPWKSATDCYALDILRWCLINLTPALTEKYWPLLVPPVLTLLDDTETKYKALGAELLGDLLKATSPEMLSRTGLSDVFRESLEPSLHYLPSLTPESESVRLLSVAYPSMFTLLSAQCPKTNIMSGVVEQNAHAQDVAEAKYKQALANLLHSNILPSFTHIEPHAVYPAITSVLLQSAGTILVELGIDSTAQLIHIIPLLRGVLAEDSFAATTNASLMCMTEAARTLNIVIANTWPRMMEWRGEVLAMLCGAWLRLVEEASRRHCQRGEDEKVSKIGEVSDLLIKNMKLLVHALSAFEADCDPDVGSDTFSAGSLQNEIETLVKTDPRLSGLLA